MKSIIFYRGGSCNELRTLAALQKMVEKVIVIAQSCKNYDMDGELAQSIFTAVHVNKAEGIFSIDYYPILAEVAHVVGIPYISWIIDSPHYTLYSSTVGYDSGYIFHFDREEAERLQNMGRTQVFHQPLATDAFFFQKCIASAAPREVVDVSFLGSSYQNEHDYLEKAGRLSEYELGYCEGLMNAQMELYGVSFLEDVIPEELQKRLIETGDIHWPDTYDIPESLVAANILEKRISIRERRGIVKRVAEKCGITLYSEAETLKMKGVNYKGYANYETEMPLVFRYSRININQTLRSIHSGIPLRALDIMGSRGFLLSNYQPELTEWFEDGRSMALYGSLDEMEEKIMYYLKHDSEREQIAHNGYQIVKKDFGYEQAISRMLKKAGIMINKSGA